MTKQQIVKQERITAIVTLIVQMFTIINAFFVAAGKNPIPFDENTITETLTYIITIAWNVWVWWHNNNVTEASVDGQKVTTMEKEKKKLAKKNK